MGSIPAHAGVPRILRRPAIQLQVYPRTRGGTVVKEITQTRSWGLSSHTRANHLLMDTQRLILEVYRRTREGTVSHLNCSPWLPRVYGRTRGGTFLLSRADQRGQGLSPHTRGNHSRPVIGLARDRSIPAHAGEPPRRVNSTRAASKVYPRTRGGTQSRQTLGGARLAGVYPRTRGGTAISPIMRVPFEKGLSPHTRGNLYDCYQGVTAVWPQVYPRTRGGTFRLQPTLARHPCFSGSIPAHAGEPWADGVCPNLRQDKVYPRTRGGTDLPASMIPNASTRVYPRTRGGTHCLDSHAIQLHQLGSIPAHAGEPWSIAVSPRANQLTGSIPAHAGEPVSQATTQMAELRSIPAHAGEPAMTVRPPLAFLHGLSPHTRGNR